MSRPLSLFAGCLLCLAAASYAESDTFINTLQARELDSHFQPAQRASVSRFGLLPRSYLWRRGNRGDRDDFRGRGNRGRSVFGSSRSGIPPQHATAQGKATGPAELYTFRQSENQYARVPAGQRRTLEAHDAINVSLSGSSSSLSNSRAAHVAQQQQQPQTPVMELTAKGQTAIGAVSAPEGGYGTIKTVTPEGSSNAFIAGGTAGADTVVTPGRNNAIVTARVTRGGIAHVTGQSRNRVAYPYHQGPTGGGSGPSIYEQRIP